MNKYLSANAYYIIYTLKEIELKIQRQKNGFSFRSVIEGIILYWKYDKLGRVIEKGYFNNQSWSTVSQSQNLNNQSFPATPATWRKKYFYDDFSITPYAQGRLCKVQTNNDDDNNVEVEETFQYDKLGNTTSASSNAADFSADTYNALYTYDNLGRVKQIDYPLYKTVSSVQSLTVGYSSEYDASSPTAMTVGPAVTIQNGGTAKLSAKDGITLNPGFTASSGSNFNASTNSYVIVRYTYNQLGQVTGVGNKSNNNYFGNYAYNEDGTLDKERLNNLTSVTTYSYNNPRGFLTAISNSKFTENLAYSNTVSSITTTYYNGSIASANFTYGTGGSSPYSYTFQYDWQNRMTSAINSANSSYNFTSIHYDNNGNLLNRYEGPDLKALTYLGSNRPVTYVINGGNPVSGGMYSINCDLTGNLIYNNYENITTSYDPFTLMTKSVSQSSNQVNFEYDGRKERILKTVNGAKTLYLRGMNDYPLTEKTTSLNRFYVYGPTGLITVIDNGTNYFILKDHLGSTHVVLDEDDSLISWYDYTPYGKIWASQISEDSRYRFTGQEYDPETNLLNFRARMYDPTLGIFYAGDPAGQGFSPYSYCGGNPVVYVDKDGRWFGLDDLFISVTSFVYGYFSHAVSTGQWGGQALTSGLIAAGTSWLAYNTGGAAASMFFDKGTAGYSILSSTVGSTVGSFTGNTVNQIRYNGNIDWNQSFKAGVAGFGGGLVGGFAEAYVNNNIGTFAGYHLTKHIISSTAYELGSHLITRNFNFSDMDFGLNFGAIPAGIADAIYTTSPIWGKGIIENKVRILC